MCVKLVIYKNYTETRGQQNINHCKSYCHLGCEAVRMEEIYQSLGEPVGRDSSVCIATR
jgi:hypothetical protein